MKLEECELEVSFLTVKMLTLVVIYFLIVLFVIFLFKEDGKIRLPPGPKPLPLIGNVHQLPRASFLSVLQRWHTTYGPIMSIRIGGQVLVFLGSSHVCHEILSKQGAWYSSRPKIPFLDRVIRGQIPASLPYGREWKLHRRFQYSILSTQAVKTYREVQDLEARQFLWEMLTSDDFEKAVNRHTHSLASTLSYGQRSAKQDSMKINEMQGLIEEIFSELLSINLLFDSIPLIGPYLNWLVGREKAGRRSADRLRAIYSEYVNSATNNGGQLSWAQKMIQETSKGLKGRERVYLESFEMHSAAVLTTRSSLWTFVLATLLHPEAVSVVQDELDTVIGAGRYPSFEDIPRLPYLNSFIKELLRWRPIVPTSLPRVATSDREYAGYHIPAGSIIIASQSVINMDQKVFDQPELFQGDRYVNNPDLPEPASFGYGRRACPGESLVRDTLFIVISRLIWGYNVVPHPEDQPPCLDEVRSKAGFFIFWPYSFRAKFQVRSPDHQTTIEHGIHSKHDGHQ
ncbi:cytochrome P450 [Aspergillus pseudonomiae]|nr:cytochrome P450 [Aspergillus pseudonomiae]